MFSIKGSFSSALAGAASAISKRFSRSKKVEESKTPLQQLFENCKASSAKQKPLIERERELKRGLEQVSRLGMLQKITGLKVGSSASLESLHQARTTSALKRPFQGAGAATGAPSSSSKILQKQVVDKTPNLEVLLTQLDAVEARLDDLLKRVFEYQASQTKKDQVVDFGSKFNPFSDNYDPSYFPDLIGEGASVDEIKAYLKSDTSTKIVKKTSNLQTIGSNLTTSLGVLVTTIRRVGNSIFKPVRDFISNLSIVKRYKTRKFIADLASKAEKRIEDSRKKDKEKLASIFADLNLEQTSSPKEVIQINQEAIQALFPESKFSNKIQQINKEAIEALFLESEVLEDGEEFRALFNDGVQF